MPSGGNQGKGGASEANAGGSSGGVGTPGAAGNGAVTGNVGFGGQPDSTDGGQPGSADGGHPASADGGGDGVGGYSGGIAGNPSSYVCSPACGEGQMCCPSGIRTECMPIDADGCNVPDLIVTDTETSDTLDITYINTATDPCVLEEGCVGGPGLRRVLVFNAGTPNIGTGDLVVGSPSMSNPDFEYSSCHDHYHFNGYAAYDLLDSAGNVAARGHKQSYCMRDEERVLDGPGVSASRVYYNCTGDLQGISRGWSDVYKVGLACQWVDITGVPPGDYVLRVRVNPDRRIYELDYDNNEILVALTIPP